MTVRQYRQTVRSRLASAQQRCCNPKHLWFWNYGGRGIEYRLPAGRAGIDLILWNLGPPAAGMTLDRIDNDGHYEIGNLRWATRSEQMRNCRPYVFTEARAEAVRVNLAGAMVRVRHFMPSGRACTDEARERGIGVRTFWSRLRAGWSVERAATEPVRRRRVMVSDD